LDKDFVSLKVVFEAGKVQLLTIIRAPAVIKSLMLGGGLLGGGFFCATYTQVYPPYPQVIHKLSTENLTGYSQA